VLVASVSSCNDAEVVGAEQTRLSADYDVHRTSNSPPATSLPAKVVRCILYRRTAAIYKYRVSRRCFDGVMAGTLWFHKLEIFRLLFTVSIVVFGFRLGTDNF